MKTGSTYGYVRVSTRDQNEARQLVAMKEFGVSENSIFMDKLSVKDFNRPQYHLLLQLLVDHGVAAILDDHDLAVVLLDVRQRLGQNLGALGV